jgi:hypothetical protein
MEREMFACTPYLCAQEETENAENRSDLSQILYIYCGINASPTNEIPAKVGLFRRYRAQNINLHYVAQGFADYGCVQWRSDNDRVFVSADGSVTNRLNHADTAVVSLTVLDIDGNTLGETSVRLYFYRFDFQLKVLRAKA